MIYLPLTNNDNTGDFAQAMLKIEGRTAKRKPVQVAEPCFCNFECEYKEKAFYNINDTSDDFTNDSFSFFVQKNDPTEVITIKIVDQNENEINIPPVYQDFSRFYVEKKWHEIFTSYGNGTYYFKISSVLFGATTEFITHKYSLIPFNSDRANGTLKIETLKTGAILNGFDYRADFDFKSFTRLQGKFWEEKITIENELFERSNRKQDVISTAQTSEYTLEIYHTSNKLNERVKEDSLSSKFYVTNYDIYASNQVQKKQIIITGIEKTENGLSTKSSYKLSCLDPIKKIKKYGY